MKTKSLRKVTLLAIFAMSLIAAISLNSCQKEIVKPKVKTGSTATKDPSASVNLLINEVNNMVFSSSKGKNEKGMGQNFNFWDTSGGVILTIDTISKPHTTKYDFGSGCVGNDGNTRTGVVLISYNNKDIRVVNNVYTISLQNYTLSVPTTQSSGGSNQQLSSSGDPTNLLGGNQMTSSPPKVTGFNGSVSYTNTGLNTNNNLVLVETGNFVSSNGSNTDTISINYQYEWIAGASSSPLADLQFSITGSCVASTSGGIVDTTTVTSPIIKNAKWSSGCNYCIQGTTSSVISGSPYITYMDFSNPGGCSGQMAVTVNGVTTIKNQ